MPLYLYIRVASEHGLVDVPSLIHARMEVCAVQREDSEEDTFVKTGIPVPTPTLATRFLLREAFQKKNSLISELGQSRGGRGPAKPKLKTCPQFGTFDIGGGGVYIVVPNCRVENFEEILLSHCIFIVILLK